MGFEKGHPLAPCIHPTPETRSRAGTHTLSLTLLHVGNIRDYYYAHFKHTPKSLFSNSWSKAGGFTQPWGWDRPVGGVGGAKVAWRRVIDWPEVMGRPDRGDLREPQKCLKGTAC